jgi:hypothetical protein
MHHIGILPNLYFYKDNNNVIALNAQWADAVLKSIIESIIEFSPI